MRGVEGKVAAIRYARETGLPFLGLCLGLQCAVIEHSRNVAGLQGAHSTEFDENTPHPVIAILKDQRNVDRKGGTMRLGADPCALEEGSLAARLYGRDMVLERHRHRYEVNPRYHRALLDSGLKLSGLSPDGRLVEIVEREGHPFFIAAQFHPEFKSRPTNAHPMFRGLIEAALNYDRDAPHGAQTGGALEGDSSSASPHGSASSGEGNGASGNASNGGANGGGNGEHGRGVWKSSDDEESLSLTLDDIRRSIGGS